MVGIMTSCDLNIGHSDLNPYMLVDPSEANKSTPETLYTNGCCDLEKWVKVKWLVWYKGSVR